MVLWLNVITSAHAGSKHINLINGYVPFLSFDEIRFYMVCILILLIFIRITLYLYPVKHKLF